MKRPFLLTLAALLAGCMNRGYNSTSTEAGQGNAVPFLSCRASASPESAITFRLQAHTTASGNVAAFSNRPGRDREPTIELEGPRVSAVEGTRWRIDVSGSLKSAADTNGKENGNVDGLVINAPNTGTGSVELNVLAQDSSHGIWVGHTVAFSNCLIADRSLLSRLPDASSVRERNGSEEILLASCSHGDKGYNLVVVAEKRSDALKPVALGFRSPESESESTFAPLSETGVSYNAQKNIARDLASGRETYVLNHLYSLKTSNPPAGAPVTVDFQYGDRGTSSEKTQGRAILKGRGRDEELHCWSFEDANVRLLFPER